MTRALPIALGLAAGAAALLALRAQAPTQPGAEVGGDAAGWNPFSSTHDPMIDNSSGNLRAFLDAIAWAEGTENAGGYRALYGSRPGALSTFGDFSDHPALLGWPGVTLTDAQCAGAGYGPGCVSTAAGRYQINRPTWRRLKVRLALPDFSPASQDDAAVELLSEKGALADILAGRFGQAVAKVATVWASLPGAGYAGQGSRELASLEAVYRARGGAVA